MCRAKQFGIGVVCGIVLFSCAAPQMRHVPPPTSKYVAPQIPNDVPNARRYLEQGQRLRLTADQVNALERIRQQYRITYNETQNLINLDQTQMHAQAQSAAPDPSSIQETVNDITRLQNNLRNSLAQAAREAENVLTPEQRRLSTP